MVGGPELTRTGKVEVGVYGTRPKTRIRRRRRLRADHKKSSLKKSRISEKKEVKGEGSPGGYWKWGGGSAQDGCVKCRKEKGCKKEIEKGDEIYMPCTHFGIGGGGRDGRDPFFKTRNEGRKKNRLGTVIT